MTLDGDRQDAPVSVALPLGAWGPFDLLAVLGEGGMGTVYRARDRRLDRMVALKFIRGGDARLAWRFQQEARAQARIVHDSVCKVHEVGEIQGRAYIAMELIEGVPLHEAQAAMSLREKVQVLRDVAAAVHAAHGLGIIHCDLKPANVMVRRLDGGRYRPVVMDFGLARDTSTGRGLTESGALLGTPQYMSPEQARGASRLDRRADVYSLGAMLHELLAGAPPFGGGTAMEVVLQVLDREPPPLRQLAPDLPADLETIVLKCLQKEPQQRYDSARALCEDLGRYLDGEPIQGRRTGVVHRLRRRARRDPVAVALACAVSLLLLCVSWVALRTHRAAQAQARALMEQAEYAGRLEQDLRQMQALLHSARALPVPAGALPISVGEGPQAACPLRFQ